MIWNPYYKCSVRFFLILYFICFWRKLTLKWNKIIYLIIFYTTFSEHLTWAQCQSVKFIPHVGNLAKPQGLSCNLKKKKKKEKEKKKRGSISNWIVHKPSKVGTNTFKKNVRTILLLSLNMGTEIKSKSHTNDNRGNNSRKRKPRYLPHNVSLSLSSYNIVFVVSLVIHHIHGFFCVTEGCQEEGCVPIKARSTRILYHLWWGPRTPGLSWSH